MGCDRSNNVWLPVRDEKVMGSCISQPEVQGAAKKAAEAYAKHKTKKKHGSSHWFHEDDGHGYDGGDEGGFGGGDAGCDIGGGGCGGGDCGGGGCGGGD